MEMEQRIRALGKRISKIYEQAEKELTEKVDSFFAKFEEADKKKAALVKAGKLSDEEYQKWRRNKMLMGDNYKNLRDNVGKTMLEANKTAASYINREIVPSYATGFNFEGKQAEDKIGGYSFDLIDENAVKRLTTSNKTILPYKIVDGRRDVRWNTKHVNSAILQGIIQGESIPKIAKRLEKIAGMNEDSAKRNARTAITGAHNSGRMDAMDKLSKDGVIVQKEWLATTGDSRTREAHLELHHVIVDHDKPFENSIGRIMFPGDPNAHPANVYNCRCAMVSVIKGFRKGMEPQPEDSHVIAEGQDITGTWERRPDQFDFEIDDVINAQGFDGLPRVVSQEEFDRAVEESGFIAQRTYSAANQEMLDLYREQLYNGKWYVDCSSGKSLFGQGMYCSADYNGVLSDGIKEDMEAYRKVGERKGRTLSYTETFTLTPDTKIIKYEDLQKMKSGNVTQEEMNQIKEKVFKSVVEGKDDEMTLYIRDFIGLPMTDKERALFDEIEDRVLDLPTEELKKISEMSREAQRMYTYRYSDAISAVKREREEMAYRLRSFDDEGSAATALGYDAISVDGEGRSGNYSVILNRTKCIFLGGK